VLVQRLTPADAEDYRKLRLSGLAESPLAFRSNLADEAGRSLGEFETKLAPSPDGASCVFGARLDDRLVGVLSVTRPMRAKLWHAAEFTGMYIAEDSRRRGIGRHLLATAIDHVRSLSGMRYVRLVVNASNTPARRLYESAGFVCVGVEPGAVFVDGRYHDEELRVLVFSSQVNAS
jgi:ribosomal protein S18 acetylase RimI-like enzyme